MADYYVDSTKVDDSGDGLSMGNAKKHISAALGLVANPLTEVTTIHLMTGDVYTEENGLVSFRNIHPANEEAKLIIQPSNWMEGSYESAANPFGGAEPFDITGDKPLSLEICFYFNNCGGIELRGLHFDPNDDGKEMNVKAAGGNSEIVFKYCSFQCADMGLIVSGPSMVSFEMCFFIGNVYTLTAANGATVALAGDNLFADPMLGALRAIDRASINVNPWQYGKGRYYTTTINTTTTHKEEFHAILLQDASSLRIPGDPMFPLDIYHGRVVVNHDGTKLPKNYYGVKLESKSLVSGADNFEFTMKNLKGETVEMPVAQQIMIDEGQDVTVVD